MRWYLKRGWHFVCDGLHLNYKRHKLLLTHRPAYPDPKQFTRNIHGHTHGKLQLGHRYGEAYERWYSSKFHLDISPELVGYRPLRLDQLLKKNPISRK